MHASLRFLILLSASFLACRRETPMKAEPATTSSATSAASGLPAAAVPTAQGNASTNPASPMSSMAAAAPSAQSSSAALAPTPIPPADLERAKRYVSALSRGRKATAAKDYAAAVGHFDQALAAEPNDARALSERGYAHLLAENFDAAAKDLEEAAKRASGADLMRQILFNQATAAEKRGDTTTAEALRMQRDELGSAKRSKSKDCSISVSRPGTKPVVVNTFREAWKEIKTAHFRHWGNPIDTLESPAIADNADEETIRKALMGNGPPGDGAFAIMTEESRLHVGHVLFVRGKQIYVHSNLGGFQIGRCPFGEGLPAVVDGDMPVIRVDAEGKEMGYMCTSPKGNDFLPCEQMTDGTPVQSYCYWTGSTFRTRVLDPKTLAIVLDIEESTEAHGTSTFQAALSRAVLTFQPGAVLVTGCGIERRETIP